MPSGTSRAPAALREEEVAATKKALGWSTRSPLRAARCPQHFRTGSGGERCALEWQRRFEACARGTPDSRGEARGEREGPSGGWDGRPSAGQPGRKATLAASGKHERVSKAARVLGASGPLGLDVDQAKRGDFTADRRGPQPPSACGEHADGRYRERMAYHCGVRVLATLFCFSTTCSVRPPLGGCEAGHLRVDARFDLLARRPDPPAVEHLAPCCDARSTVISARGPN